jgi:LysM repeat protein
MATVSFCEQTELPGQRTPGWQHGLAVKLIFMPLVFPSEIPQLLRYMLKVVLSGVLFVFAATGACTTFAQSSQSLSTDVANLSEDIRGLKQRVNELQLRVEQLENENRELRGKATNNYATIAQLNEAVADMNRTVKAAAASAKTETLQQVSVQMEKLAKQTNAAIESLANGINARSSATSTSTASTHATQTTFSDDYPKEGTNYTVQKGETLAVIARKTGAKPQDIINANKISDPSKIQAGQSLFIPGGK